MITGNFKHYPYMHERVPARMARESVFFEPVITFAFQKQDMDDWSAFDNWLVENEIQHFAWTPFSTAWRKFYTFARKEDAMLFKLTFR